MARTHVHLTPSQIICATGANDPTDPLGPFNVDYQVGVWLASTEAHLFAIPQRMRCDAYACLHRANWLEVGASVHAKLKRRTPLLLPPPWCLACTLSSCC